MQLRIQPKVQNQQGTRIYINEGEGESFRPNLRHRRLKPRNSTQISFIRGNGVPSVLPGMFSLAQTGQLCLQSFLGYWF